MTSFAEAQSWYIAMNRRAPTHGDSALLHGVSPCPHVILQCPGVHGHGHMVSHVNTLMSSLHAFPAYQYLLNNLCQGISHVLLGSSRLLSQA